jgi:hypothetical protein
MSVPVASKMPSGSRPSIATRAMSRRLADAPAAGGSAPGNTWQTGDADRLAVVRNRGGRSGACADVPVNRVLSTTGRRSCSAILRPNVIREWSDGIEVELLARAPTGSARRPGEPAGAPDMSGHRRLRPCPRHYAASGHSGAPCAHRHVRLTCRRQTSQVLRCQAAALVWCAQAVCSS